jgi:hypothetical protein
MPGFFDCPEALESMKAERARIAGVRRARRTEDAAASARVASRIEEAYRQRMSRPIGYVPPTERGYTRPYPWGS